MTAPDPSSLHEAAVRAAAALLELPITDEQLPGVVRNHAFAATMARQVMGFALTPADESGNVFVPVVPRAPGAGGAP